MKNIRLPLKLLVIACCLLAGCSRTSTQSADVAGPIRKSLDDAGLHDVSVSQDRTKGVVTLDGHVVSDTAKAEAESIAKSMAGNQVVANQIAVIPQGVERDAKSVYSDLDKGIENNLDAALIENRLKNDVRYDVKNGVVTLKGSVNSQSKRAQAGKIASGVPNVQQVVNELQVENQKASSSR